MAAATAFFSFFALPPITIILSQVYGNLLDGHDRRVSWQLFRELSNLFGHGGAKQLQAISENIQERPTGHFSTATGVHYAFCHYQELAQPALECKASRRPTRLVHAR